MYTNEEKEIVDYIETQNPQRVVDFTKKLGKIKQAVEAKTMKRKAINLKVLESDIERLKVKALEEGMGYQTLINSVLHKYITGQLVDKKLVS